MIYNISLEAIRRLVGEKGKSGDASGRANLELRFVSSSRNEAVCGHSAHARSGKGIRDRVSEEDAQPTEHVFLRNDTLLHRRVAGE